MIQSRHHFKQGRDMRNLNRSQKFLSFCHLQGLGCVCKVPRKQSFQFDVDIVNLLIILFCLCIEVGGGAIPQNTISYALNKRKTFAPRRNWESTSPFQTATYLQSFMIITMELSCQFFCFLFYFCYRI